LILNLGFFGENPHPKGWGYTDEARLRGLIQDLVFKVYKNPHPEGWGYTDEARLRGLRDNKQRMKEWEHLAP
jgi:hypothetical protein